MPFYFFYSKNLFSFEVNLYLHFSLILSLIFKGFSYLFLPVILTSEFIIVLFLKAVKLQTAIFQVKTGLFFCFYFTLLIPSVPVFISLYLSKCLIPIFKADFIKTGCNILDIQRLFRFICSIKHNLSTMHHHQAIAVFNRKLKIMSNH